MTQNSAPTEGNAALPAGHHLHRTGEGWLEHIKNHHQALSARQTLSSHADELMREQGGVKHALKPVAAEEKKGPLAKPAVGQIDQLAFLKRTGRTAETVGLQSLTHLTGYSLDTSVPHQAQTPAERLAAAPARGDATLLQPALVPRDSEHPVRNITVVYQNQSGDAKQDNHPDYRVLQDGTVQTLHDAAFSNSDRIVVEVARNPGDMGKPNAQQQQAVDKLVSELSSKFMLQHIQPDGTHTLEGQIDDAQGLVSPRVLQSQRTAPTPIDELPPETRSQIQNTNRWHDAGRGPHGQGRFTNRQAGEQFAPRDVPRQTRSDDETVAVASMKDVVSGFITRGEKDPYHAVKHWGPEGLRVGRYGTTANQYRSWLAGLSEAQVKELIAEGKLPKGALEYAEFLKQHPDGVDQNGQLKGGAKELSDFLNKLQKGDENDKPTTAEIDKFFNKNLQEKMGSDLIRSYAQATADNDPSRGGLMANIPKIALSMYLGHPVTDQEASDPRYQALMDAALKAWPLAVQKEQGVGDIDLSNAARTVASLARANEGRALWQGSGTGANLGCASSVWNLLQQAGFRVPHDNVARSLGEDLAHEGWQRDSFEHRRPGDVVVCMSGPGGHGHIGVIGNGDVSYSNSSGSGQWSPANAARYWMHRSRNGAYGLYVLHPPGNSAA